MLGNHFLNRREYPIEDHECIWQRERGKCAVVKVWLWTCRRCAGMPSVSLSLHMPSSVCWRACDCCSSVTSSCPHNWNPWLLPDQRLSRPVPSFPKDPLNSFSASGSPKMHTSCILATNSVSAGNGSNQSGANCWLQRAFVLSSTGLPNRKSPLRVSSQPESAGRTHTSSGA